MFFGVIVPETLNIANYHVTELVPLPALKPEPLPKPKPLPVRAKLLPPDPVFKAPKLVVPREVCAPSRNRRKSNHPKSP